MLDNCEHLLEAVARLVDRVVQNAARVTVLATSREGLALPGERMVALPSLGIDDEAVSLFVERATDARAGFHAHTRQRCPPWRRSVARLDGIPLAIELAAARVAGDDARRDRGTARRPASACSRAAAGPRWSVTRRCGAAIDWSYDLLERRRAHRAAAPVGVRRRRAPSMPPRLSHGRTRSTSSTCSTTSQRLSVGRWSSPTSSEQETRYRLLETIRQYAQDRLDESGETDAVGRRHATHYCSLAEEAGPHLRAADQLTWIARLAPEFDNLRVALTWALDHDDLDLALTLVVSVCVNGIDVGYLALTWAELAAAAPGIDEHPLGAALLAQAAWSAVLGGRLDEAGRYEARRVAAEVALGLPSNPANFQAPATIALFSGRPRRRPAERARDWIAAAREAGDRYETVQGLTMLPAALIEDVPVSDSNARGSYRRGAPARKPVEPLVGPHGVRAVSHERRPRTRHRRERGSSGTGYRDR